MARPGIIMYDIETHPILTGLIIFVVAFVGINIFKKTPVIPGSNTPGVPGPGQMIDPTTGQIVALPQTSETYNQVYNQYPTVPGPVGAPPIPTPVPTPVLPVPTPTPTPTPTPKPTCIAGVDYGLVPFDAYTGPSYSNLGSNVHWSYGGVDYRLGTGGGGHLYGTTTAGKQVLLRTPVSFYPGGSNYRCK